MKDIDAREALSTGAASPYATKGRGRTETGTIQMMPLINSNNRSVREGMSPGGKAMRAAVPEPNWQDKINQYVPLFGSPNNSSSDIDSSGKYQSLDSTEHAQAA